MTWVKLENGKIIGFCLGDPPMLESGEMEPGWEERVDYDPFGQNDLIEPARPLQREDWNRLTELLRGSALWNKAFTASMQSVAANAAFTLLLTTLTSTHAIVDFSFAVRTLRQILQSDPGLTDFSDNDLDSFKNMLSECGFNPAIADYQATFFTGV